MLIIYWCHLCPAHQTHAGSLSQCCLGIFWHKVSFWDCLQAHCDRSFQGCFCLLPVDRTAVSWYVQSTWVWYVWPPPQLPRGISAPKKGVLTMLWDTNTAPVLPTPLVWLKSCLFWNVFLPLAHPPASSIERSWPLESNLHSNLSFAAFWLCDPE